MGTAADKRPCPRQITGQEHRPRIRYAALLSIKLVGGHPFKQPREAAEIDGMLKTHRRYLVKLRREVAKDAAKNPRTNPAGYVNALTAAIRLIDLAKDL